MRGRLHLGYRRAVARQHTNRIDFRPMDEEHPELWIGMSTATTVVLGWLEFGFMSSPEVI